MYHNIERRQHAATQYPAAKYCGWDAAGRFHYIGKGKARGNLWWAVAREGDNTAMFGETLREISEKLAAKA